LEELSQVGSQEEVEAAVEVVAEQFESVIPLMQEFLDATDGSITRP
jgi:hypothetical protein